MCVQWAAQSIKQKKSWGRQKSLVLETCRIWVQKLDGNWSSGWPHRVRAAPVGSTCSFPGKRSPPLAQRAHLVLCLLSLRRATPASIHLIHKAARPQQCSGPLVAAVERMWPEGLRVVPSLEARGQRGFAKHASVWKLQDLSQSLC